MKVAPSAACIRRSRRFGIGVTRGWVDPPSILGYRAVLSSNLSSTPIDTFEDYGKFAQKYNPG